MDSIISVRVFEWRSGLWLAVDRIGSSADRRHAPRSRLATFHAPPVPGVSLEDGILWMHERLTDWVNAGCPPQERFSAPALSAPPSGGHGGARVATGDTPNAPLPSKTEPPADYKAGGVAASDGLSPEGCTPPLF